jgi:hypothetical protein
LAGLAAILGLSLVASGHQALADDPTIKIANFTFDPPTSTIKAGTTVTWVNADDIPHLVSEKDGKFRSSALDTDEKFSQTFSTAGTPSDPSPMSLALGENTRGNALITFMKFLFRGTSLRLDFLWPLAHLTGAVVV